ncbi:hypothetical protein [Nitrosomonas sp. Nm166]|uniref:hypothetical protein n=1 Tax=Nitrosomonas sp. Nm166 TaxID=1881054 RepID=UPI00210DB624|nr:hypothetical protein [Nitrosomonas sp. Nm166]
MGLKEPASTVLKPEEKLYVWLFGSIGLSLRDCFYALQPMLAFVMLDLVSLLIARVGRLSE